MIWPRGEPSKGRWRCVSTPDFFVFCFAKKAWSISSLVGIIASNSKTRLGFGCSVSHNRKGRRGWEYLLVGARRRQRDRRMPRHLAWRSTGTAESSLVRDRDRTRPRGLRGEPWTELGRETMQRTGRSPVHVLRPRRAQPHRAFFSWHVRISFANHFFYLSSFLSFLTFSY